MNSKMLVAFLLGGLLAAGLVLMMKPYRTPAVESLAPVEDTAPAMEQSAPAPTPAEPAARPEPRRPRTEPVAKTARPSQTNQNRVEVASAKPVEPPVPARIEPEPVPAPPQAEPKKSMEILRPSRDPQPTVKREPKIVTIPAGTVLNVRLMETLSTKSNSAGDAFSATLDAPVVIDGFVIAERGAHAEGRIVAADKGGKVKGLAQLTLALSQFKSSDGQIVKIQTDSFVRDAEKSTKKDALKVGIGAGIGAAIGAIAGGGKGAAIGAGAGGAAGTGAVLATRGEAAELGAETRVSFRLSAPVSVTERLP